MMTTSLSSDALLNYKKVTWKMKVEKRKSKKRQKILNRQKSHKTFEPIFKSFTFMSFID